MRFITLCLLIALALPNAVRARDVLDEVLEADRAFAALSEERGLQAAFASYLDSESVLFRPAAVAGVEWNAAHEPASGRLQWQPSAGAVSCTGNMAVTIGQWRYDNDIDGAAAEGHYLTVWRRDADLGWRVVFDHGTNDPDPQNPGMREVAETLGSIWPSDPARQCDDSVRQRDAKRRERLYNKEIRSRGLMAARTGFGWPRAIAFRELGPPTVFSGQWPRDDFLSAGSGELRARTIGWQGESQSDLFVSHGEFRAQQEESNEASALAAYLRIWAPRGDEWRVAVEMLLPLLEEATAD
jgi:ketosteroid isomerase-like protein